MSEQPEAEPTPDQSDSSRDSSPDPDQDSSKDSEQDLDPGEPGDVGDAQLPADLQPTADNPLARHPGQTGDDDDKIGADREGDPETAPLTQDDSDYGGGAGQS